jgi:hypothetical protein
MNEPFNFIYYFFNPHANSMFPAGKNMLDWSWKIFATFALLTGASTGLAFFQNRRSLLNNQRDAKNFRPGQRELFRTRANLILFSILITLSGLQLSAHLAYSRRNIVFHPRFYQIMAQSIVARFPGKHNAELITDLRPDIDPDAYFLKMFQYYLYPIDTNNIRSGNKDLLVILRCYGSPAGQQIPENYVIIYQPHPAVAVAVRMP